MLNLKHSLVDLEELRTHLIQDFFTSFVRLFWTEEEWRQILFDGINREASGAHASKYLNFKRKIDDKGQDNITINDMDTSLVCNVLLFFNTFKQQVNLIDKKLPSVLTFFIYDRNSGLPHSSYNESDYESFISCIGSVFQMNQLIVLLRSIKKEEYKEHFMSITDSYDYKIQTYTSIITDQFYRINLVNKEIDEIKRVIPFYGSIDRAIMEKTNIIKESNLLCSPSQIDTDQYEYYYYLLAKLGSILAHKRLGAFYINKGRFREAEETFRQAISLSNEAPGEVGIVEDLQLYLASIYTQAPGYEHMKDEGQKIISDIANHFNLHYASSDRSFVIYQTGSIKTNN